MTSDVGDKGDVRKLNKAIGLSLDETVIQAAALALSKPDAVKAWQKARVLVEEFRPIPWFIWRISNYVFGKSGQLNVVPEGMVMGLKKLMFAAASDSIMGSGQPVTNMKLALSTLRSDVIAASSVIHAICRRLATRQHERIWRPILDDALLRAQLGFFVGERRGSFGSGRGMLAGFAGKAGLAVLIASGDLEQARTALDRLAGGENVSTVGQEVYGCDALQVSAMMLSASGCGRDAGFGTVSYASQEQMEILENDEQKAWRAAFTICEKIRTNSESEIDDSLWLLLRYDEKDPRAHLVDMSKLLVRTGTNWSWLV